MKGDAKFQVNHLIIILSVLDEPDQHSWPGLETGNGRLTVNLTGQQGLSTVFITSEPSGFCEAFYSNKSLQSGPACSVAPKIPEKKLAFKNSLPVQSTLVHFMFYSSMLSLKKYNNRSASFLLPKRQFSLDYVVHPPRVNIITMQVNNCLRL